MKQVKPTKQELICSRTAAIMTLWLQGKKQEQIAKQLKIKRSMVADTINGRFNTQKDGGK